MIRKPWFIIAFLSVTLLLGSCSTTDVVNGINKAKEFRELATTVKNTTDSLKNTTNIANSSTIEVIVTRVIDGDTAIVNSVNNNGTKNALKNVKIRELSFDTPEDTTKKQYLGNVATKRAKELIEGKKVRIEVSANSNPYDRYGRLLAYIWLDKNTMLEDVLLSEGLAQVRYIYPPDTKYVARFTKEQNEAKSKKMGIWSIPNYAQRNGYHMEAIKP